LEALARRSKSAFVLVDEAKGLLISKEGDDGPPLLALVDVERPRRPLTLLPRSEPPHLVPEAVERVSHGSGEVGPLIDDHAEGAGGKKVAGADDGWRDGRGWRVSK
jgi:hypothetical protein